METSFSQYGLQGRRPSTTRHQVIPFHHHGQSELLLLLLPIVKGIEAGVVNMLQLVDVNVQPGMSR